jgi:threonine dehydrogenase-like Zn-dependent dehydrogenase
VDITVSEPAEPRRERASMIGAARTVAPAALTDAPTGRVVDAPYAVAFECSGHAQAAERALDPLDYGGTLVFVGTGRELPRINHNRMIILELTATGAYNYDDGGFEAALDLLASGDLPVDALIEPEDVTLGGVMEAMHRLARGEIPGKLLVRPETS